MVSSNLENLKISKNRPKVGPLTPYKAPFKPINRPWDRSRSIDLDEIYILVYLELHSAYLMAIHAETRVNKTQTQTRIVSSQGVGGSPTLTVSIKIKQKNGHLLFLIFF